MKGLPKDMKEINDSLKRSKQKNDVKRIVYFTEKRVREGKKIKRKTNSCTLFFNQYGGSRTSEEADR